MAESFASYRLTNPTTRTAPFIYTTGGLKTFGAIHPKRCNLLVLTGFNAAQEPVFVQLFEQSPLRGAIPAWMVAVPRRGSFSWVPAQGGRTFSKLYFAVSSTPETYTPAAMGVWVDAEGVGLE